MGASPLPQPQSFLRNLKCLLIEDRDSLLPVNVLVGVRTGIAASLRGHLPLLLTLTFPVPDA